MRKLTARNIAKIKHPGSVKGARDFPDELVMGLSLVVQPSGVKSWCVRYRVKGRQRRYTIGRAEAIDIAHARKLARGILLKVAEGIDPADVERSHRAARLK